MDLELAHDCTSQLIQFVLSIKASLNVTKKHSCTEIIIYKNVFHCFMLVRYNMLLMTK